MKHIVDDTLIKKINSNILYYLIDNNIDKSYMYKSLPEKLLNHI
jgi:hypothetical protein